METFRYTKVPQEMYMPAAHQGSVKKLNYPAGRHGTKYTYVYTPYGYDGSDMSTRYDILYLMHGSSSGAETFLWGEGQNSHFKNMLDHAIESGLIKPLIVVTPGLYPTSDADKYKGQEIILADEMVGEISDKLMKSVESMFLTYADTIDEEGFRASRSHRAMAGFSMGAVVTWYMVGRHMDKFARFIPICGDCWIYGRFGGEQMPVETAQWLADTVAYSGYTPDGYRIYCATGRRDMALAGMTNQIQAMKAHGDIFRVSDADDDPPRDQADSNLMFYLADEGRHDYFFAYEYILSALKVCWQ